MSKGKILRNWKDTLSISLKRLSTKIGKAVSSINVLGLKYGYSIFKKKPIVNHYSYALS